MAREGITIDLVERTTVFDQRQGAMDVYKITFTVEGLGSHSVTVPAADFRAEVAVAEVRRLADELRRLKGTFE